VGTVVDVVPETADARSIALRVPGWPGHRAGQHVDLRLTAEDGYTAQRSYSIASAPEDDHLLLTVERLPDGEVSPYLVDELRRGDELEVRGPIGGYFAWQESLGGPLLLVAGGSGVVPFRSVLRHHQATGSTVGVRLLCSARSLPSLIYRDELTSCTGPVEVSVTLTREQPDGWRGYRRRVDRDLLAEVGWPAARQPLCYVCGPTGFVETVTAALVDLGHTGARIRAERFGGTGS
jgi:ferredoxin-NADP reductase